MENNNNGLGTLLIFIGLILLASICAGLLIKVSYELQQKSLEVGEYHKNKSIDCYDYLIKILNHKEITFYSNGTTFVDNKGYSQYDYYTQCESVFKRGVN